MTSSPKASPEPRCRATAQWCSFSTWNNSSPSRFTRPGASCSNSPLDWNPMALSSPSLLARQPILNRTQEIVGYDLRLAGQAPSGALLKVLGEAPHESFFAQLPNRFVLA